MATGEFAWRLARQIDVGETMFLEFLVNGHWNAAHLRKWMIGTRALLDKEYTSSSSILRAFIDATSNQDVGCQSGWKEALDKSLEILLGIQQSVAPLGDDQP